MGLVDRIERSGAEAVRLDLDGTHRDKITSKTTTAPHRYRLLSIADIRRALEWVSFDTWISVAGELFDQHSGLPMGSCYSPILARVYLDTSHHKLYKQPRTLPQIIRLLRLLGRNVASWLQTKCHVDDSLWFSRALCTSCIFELVRAVWPQDVGVTLEEEGTSCTFLHCDVLFDEGGIHVQPRVVNTAYACGLEERPRVSAFPPFRFKLSLRTDLRLVLAAKLHLLLRGFKPADWAQYGKKPSTRAWNHFDLLGPRGGWRISCSPVFTPRTDLVAGSICCWACGFAAIIRWCRLVFIDIMSWDRNTDFKFFAKPGNASSLISKARVCSTSNEATFWRGSSKQVSSSFPKSSSKPTRCTSAPTATQMPNVSAMVWLGCWNWPATMMGGQLLWSFGRDHGRTCALSPPPADGAGTFSSCYAIGVDSFTGTMISQPCGYVKFHTDMKTNLGTDSDSSAIATRVSCFSTSPNISRDTHTFCHRCCQWVVDSEHVLPPWF